ncbi:hypothetical protein G9A89_006221 [Geosiphon pyriformis]|nr:hypothetical protein G9A89_006221 [Geosiphon pyriformis]
MESENLTFDSLRMATLLLLLHKRQQQLAITMKTIFEPERPLIPNTRLDLNALDEGTCVAFFRFNKTQIEQLLIHYACYFGEWLIQTDMLILFTFLVDQLMKFLVSANILCIYYTIVSIISSINSTMND